MHNFFMEDCNIFRLKLHFIRIIFFLFDTQKTMLLCTLLNMFFDITFKFELINLYFQCTYLYIVGHISGDIYYELLSNMYTGNGLSVNKKTSRFPFLKRTSFPI